MRMRVKCRRRLVWGNCNHDLMIYMSGGFLLMPRYRYLIYLCTYRYRALRCFYCTTVEDVMESRDVDGRPRCRYISTGIPLRLRTVHSALLHAPHHLHHPHTPSELFGCDCRLYLGGRRYRQWRDWLICTKRKGRLHVRVTCCDEYTKISNKHTTTKAIRIIEPATQRPADYRRTSALLAH